MKCAVPTRPTLTRVRASDRAQHDLELKQMQRQLEEIISIEEAKSTQMEMEFSKLVEQLERKQVSVAAATAAKEEMAAASMKQLMEQHESELSTLTELLELERGNVELEKQASISAAAQAKEEAVAAKEEAVVASMMKLMEQHESELSILTATQTKQKQWMKQAVADKAECFDEDLRQLKVQWTVDTTALEEGLAALEAERAEHALLCQSTEAEFTHMAAKVEVSVSARLAAKEGSWKLWLDEKEKSMSAKMVEFETKLAEKEAKGAAKLVDKRRWQVSV